MLCLINLCFGRGFLLPLLSPFIHKLNKWTIKKEYTRYG